MNVKTSVMLSDFVNRPNVCPKMLILLAAEPSTDNDILDLACQNWTSESQHSREDFYVQQIVLLLQQAGWLRHMDRSTESRNEEASQKNTDGDDILTLLVITKERLAWWKKEIESQELVIATA